MHVIKPKTAILHYTAPPVIGGVEAVIKAHAKAFLQADYPVALVAGRGDADALPSGVDLFLIPELDSQHPEILEMSHMLEQGRVPTEFDTLVSRIIESLTAVLSSFDNAIIHNVLTKHFNLPLTSALHTLLDAGVIRKCIGWCHDFTWTSPMSRSKVFPGYPWDLLRTFRNDVTYVVVSQRRQRTLAALFGCYPEQIRVVYNGVDADLLLGLSQEGRDLVDRLGLVESDLIMLMPVRITQSKNLELALRVVAALRDEKVGVKLVVTGPPDPHDPGIMAYYQSLKALRDQLYLEAEVCFVFESGPDPARPYTIGLQLVGQLFRASDLMFMPSHREGFGMPVLEAALVRMPVMCTDVPAAVEIGGSDVLYFDSSEEPNAIARMILDWAKADPAHRLRRRIRQNYTWQAIFENAIEPLLQSTC